MMKHKFYGLGSIKSNILTPHMRLDNNAIPLDLKNAFSLELRIVSKTYQWTWKHLPIMLRSAELNTFSKTNTFYRKTMYRANGEIYRLSGGTPWRYDGKASCMSKQSVTLLYWFWRPA